MRVGNVGKNKLLGHVYALISLIIELRNWKMVEGEKSKMTDFIPSYMVLLKT